jgi:hypothetical protein
MDTLNTHCNKLTTFSLVPTFDTAALRHHRMLPTWPVLQAVHQIPPLHHRHRSHRTLTAPLRCSAQIADKLTSGSWEVVKKVQSPDCHPDLKVSAPPAAVLRPLRACPCCLCYASASIPIARLALPDALPAQP